MYQRLLLLLKNFTFAIQIHQGFYTINVSWVLKFHISSEKNQRWFLMKNLSHLVYDWNQVLVSGTEIKVQFWYPLSVSDGLMNWSWFCMTLAFGRIPIPINLKLLNPKLIIVMCTVENVHAWICRRLFENWTYLNCMHWTFRCWCTLWFGLREKNWWPFQKKYVYIL